MTKWPIYDYEIMTLFTKQVEHDKDGSPNPDIQLMMILFLSAILPQTFAENTPKNSNDWQDECEKDSKEESDENSGVLDHYFTEVFQYGLYV